MAPTDERLRWFGEIPDHLSDQPFRFSRAQRAAPGHVADQVIERSPRSCHCPSMSDSVPEGKDPARNRAGSARFSQDLPDSARRAEPPAAGAPFHEATRRELAQAPQHGIEVHAGRHRDPGRPPAGAGRDRLQHASADRIQLIVRQHRAPPAGRTPRPGRTTRCASTSATPVTHCAPQSRMTRWQPADAMDVTGPGTAISGRFRSRACRAVFSAPLRSAASTTHRAAAERGDQPVAHQEPGPGRGPARWLLADQCAVPGDGLEQLVVAARVRVIDA